VNAAPDVYTGPAFIGWRSWRILPFERLGRPESIRLAASGTNGLPKLWEPGRPMVATCGRFETTHEAPWPECSCGFYAYRTRRDAWEHLQTFVDNNGDNTLGWAFGRVSLWGRIVECEHGWRSEFAYPYAIEVYGESSVAQSLRGLYGIDVERHEPLEQSAQEEEDEEETADRLGELAAIRNRLRAISASIATERDEEAEEVAEAAPATQRRRFSLYTWRSTRSDREKKRELRLLIGRQREPLTARDLLEVLAEGEEVLSHEVGAFAHELRALALAREVIRLRGPDHRLYWSGGAVPPGFVEDSPADDDLEQDVPLIQAIVSVGCGSPVAAGDALASLPEEIRPARSQEWSVAFGRLAMRGWARQERPAREWQPTELGERVARRGQQLALWPEAGTSALLEELSLAVREAEGPVTVADLTWRFDTSWLHEPSGHRLGQALLRLEQDGRVVRCGREGGRLLWKPRARQEEREPN